MKFSDEDQGTSDAGSEEEESDVSEQEIDIEEENEEENWVVASREPTGLDFTADRGLNADLPDNPSFVYSFPNSCLNILQDRPLNMPQKPLLF